MKYNIYYHTATDQINILDISRSQLDKLVEAYAYGEEGVFIKGRSFHIKGILEIQIYENKSESMDEKFIWKFCRSRNLQKIDFTGFDEFIPKEALERFGDRVTDDFIMDIFGYKNNEKHAELVHEYYVDHERLEELKAIKNKSYDLTKLIQFLNEINSAHINNLLLSIPMLVRAIIDHIPPVFEKSSFKEVCANYGSKSFKESMINLEKSSRKIADGFLHTQIRSKENLPNKTQVDFRNDLDVLLQEIIRINKK